MNKELLTKDAVSFQEIGAEISHELAAKMVKSHQDMYSEDASCSYFIGADAINMILSQPGCVGMRFFDAINEAGKKTLVYVGIDKNGKSILELTTVNEGGKLSVIKASAGDELLVKGPIGSWWS